ncbi:MAG: hypothetical protein ACOH1J_06680 [Microbacteriaceae bacterium]
MSTKTLKVGLYWRKSKYFGGLCPPGVFTLTTERLSFVTEDGVLFDLPVSEARATLSAWGTLTVHSRERSFDLLATAGQDSRSFSRSQQRELGAAGAKKPEAAAGTKPVRELAKILQSRGVRTEMSRPVNAYVLYGCIALAVAIAVAILLVSR